MFFRHEPSRKILRLRKELSEVLANAAQTLREALSPNVSPVAEANSSIFFLFAGVLPLMPDNCERFKTSVRLATSPSTPCRRFSLLSTVFLLYHRIGQSARGIYNVAPPSSVLPSEDLVNIRRDIATARARSRREWASLFRPQRRIRGQREGGKYFQHRTTVELIHKSSSSNVAMLIAHSREDKAQLAKNIYYTHHSPKKRNEAQTCETGC